MSGAVDSDELELVVGNCVPGLVDALAVGGLGQPLVPVLGYSVVQPTGPGLGAHIRHTGISVSGVTIRYTS